MYSRNTRQFRRAAMNTNAPVQRPNVVENGGNTLPEPPPNYRGMLYEANIPSENNAEGIDRLVREDESYKEYEKNIRRNEYLNNMPKKQPFSNVVEGENLPETESGGLHTLIDGLAGKRFEAEDILICAMIILMLNSSSEDDILMVLVLMMLL